MTLGRLKISAGFFPGLAALYLLDTEGLFFKILLCCAIHEGGHVLAARLGGGRAVGLTLSLAGGELACEYPRPSYWAELAAASGGGLAGLLAAAAFSVGGAFVLSGVSLALSVFNFLPVRPLDGGRILNLALCALTGPEKAEKLSRLLDAGLSLGLFGLCLWLYVSAGAALGLLLASAWLCAAALRAG